MSHDSCEDLCYNEEKMSRLKGQIVKNNTQAMALIFKALADETRVKIGLLLCQEEELCVCDIANIVGTSIPNVSHHLRLLRNMGLAKFRKEGKLVFYSLDDDHVKQLILLTLEHSMEEKKHG